MTFCYGNCIQQHANDVISTYLTNPEKKKAPALPTVTQMPSGRKNYKSHSVFAMKGNFINHEYLLHPNRT